MLTIVMGITNARMQSSLIVTWIFIEAGDIGGILTGILFVGIESTVRLWF